MFEFSEHGIKNPGIYKRLYAEFINYCKTKAKQGTFSTYMEGEPVFFCLGNEFSYSQYKKVIESEGQLTIFDFVS